MGDKMKNKCAPLEEKNEYGKIQSEYNNLYGFDIGNNEHLSALAKKNKTIRCKRK